MPGAGFRRSPLHEALKASGAQFGSKFGWERPNWFALPGTTSTETPSFEGKPNWFDAVGEEAKAIRERVALIDQTSFPKFEIFGPGRAGCAEPDRGRRSFRRAGPRFLYAALQREGRHRGRRDAWSMSAPGRFMLRDRLGVRRARCRLGRAGICRTAVDDARDHEQYRRPQHLRTEGARGAAVGDPRRHLQRSLSVPGGETLEVGLARVLAVRIGYVGELGFELYIPQEYAAHVYETLRAAGEQFGIADAGYRAIESCRLEKGYLYWSADMTPETTPSRRVSASRWSWTRASSSAATRCARPGRRARTAES